MSQNWRPHCRLRPCFGRNWSVFSVCRICDKEALTGWRYAQVTVTSFFFFSSGRRLCDPEGVSTLCLCDPEGVSPRCEPASDGKRIAASPLPPSESPLGASSPWYISAISTLEMCEIREISWKLPALPSKEILVWVEVFFVEFDSGLLVKSQVPFDMPKSNYGNLPMNNSREGPRRTQQVGKRVAEGSKRVNLKVAKKIKKTKLLFEFPAFG